METYMYLDASSLFIKQIKYTTYIYTYINMLEYALLRY